MSDAEAAPVRVLVVDDQALFREGGVTLLSAQEGVEVVGEAADGREAVERVERLRPAVVLMDLRMPVLDGVAATREVVARHPESRVIVLTTFDDDEEVFDALRAGAVGYLLKDVSSEKLAEAIRVASRGESFLQPSIASKVLAERNRRPPGLLPVPVGDPEEHAIRACRVFSAASRSRET